MVRTGIKKRMTINMLIKTGVRFAESLNRQYQKLSLIHILNGSSGIAVGMATNIPPHNMGEVIDAICCLIDNPDARLEDLMQHCLLYTSYEDCSGAG